MAFLKRKDYQEILFKTSIASMAIYKDDPKDPKSIHKYLEGEASFNHEISKIRFSQTYTDKGLKYFNKLHHVKYLIIDDEKNKRLYISFRGTQTLQDILNDGKIYGEVNRIKGRFHSGFYQLAEIVPLEYFIAKLADEKYDLIFTGHSLGAAIAAMITIKILYGKGMTKKYSDKIMFIGYGCPSIADIYFQEENDQLYKDNFIFIKNENDIVVEILDYISFLIYNNNNKDSLNIFAGFFEEISPYINNHIEAKILEALCKQFSFKSAAITKFIIPEYKQFGSLFKLTTSEGLESVEAYNFDFEELFQIFNDSGGLIGKIQDHFIDNYFRKLKNRYFQDKIDLANRNSSIAIDLIDDLSLQIVLKEPKITMDKNRDNTVIKLYIENNNNVDHLIAIKLILGETIVYFQKDIRKLFSKKDDCIEIDFICSNDLIYDTNGENMHDEFTFEFYSHFNQIQMNIVPTNLREGLNQKLRTIQDMPFDLLYLHAAYFIHIMNRMGSNNNNKQNEKFMKAKDDLLDIFVSLDEILHEIRGKDKYSENDKNEINNLVSEYMDELKINREEKEKFIELFKDIQLDYNLIGFEKTIVSANEPEELLKMIVPYLYEIKKRKFRISTLSDYLFNEIYYRTFFEKCSKAALDLGFVILKVAAGAAGVAGVAGVAVAGAGAALAGAGVAAAAAAAGAAGAGAAAGAAGAGAGVAAAAAAAGAGAAVAGAGVAAAAAAAGVAAGAAAGAGVAVAAGMVEVAVMAGAAGVAAGAIVQINSAYLKFKFNVPWDENKVYREIVMSINNNNDAIKTIRDYENKFNNEFINNWHEKSDHAIFKIIILNRKIRDILCENNIIGTIGTKKNGKSTFVKLISNQNVPTSSDIATTCATSYSICENNETIKYSNTIIIDYPHSNNSNFFHKLEFYFTRLLLSHIYLIFPAKNNGETEHEKDLYKLITSDKFFGFTFLYNESDAFYNNNDYVGNAINFDEKRIRVRENLETTEARIKEKILFTCLLEAKARIIAVFRDEMIRDGVLLEEELRKKVFELLDNLERALSKLKNK